MPASRPAPRPAVDRSAGTVLDVATRLLLADPQASLGDVAGAVGIGRTTLHRLFPTRTALLTAIAHDALDRLDTAYATAGAADDAVDPVAALHRVVELLVPLGPRLQFLVRSTELHGDPGLAERAARVDEPLHRAVGRAQAAGAVDPALRPEWVVDALYAVTYTAWEHVEQGSLAPRDAAPLVVRTWLRGVRPGAG